MGNELPKQQIQPNFSSGNGMQTHTWGPLMWMFLHIMSFNFPEKPTEQQKLDYFNFLYALSTVLPCCHCRDNMVNNMKQAGLSCKSFANRGSFSRFVFRLHNEVNKTLDKPLWRPANSQNDEEAYQYLKKSVESCRARCSSIRLQNRRVNIKDVTIQVSVIGCNVLSIL